MKLIEWKQVLAYANENIQLPRFSYSEYNISNTYRRGLYIYILMDNGSIFERYATGIHDTVEDYCSAIDKGIERLTEEFL